MPNEAVQKAKQANKIAKDMTKIEKKIENNKKTQVKLIQKDISQNQIQLS